MDDEYRFQYQHEREHQYNKELDNPLPYHSDNYPAEDPFQAHYFLEPYELFTGFECFEIIKGCLARLALHPGEKQLIFEVVDWYSILYQRTEHFAEADDCIALEMTLPLLPKEWPMWLSYWHKRVKKSARSEVPSCK